MIKYNHDAILRKITQQRNALLVAGIGLLVVAVCLSLSVFSLSGKRERAIITPVVVDNTFWVDDNKVSESYLALMSDYFLKLALNATPDSIENQIQQFLKHVDTKNYGQVKADLIKQQHYIKDKKITLAFYPSQPPSVNTKTLSVETTGKLVRFIGKQPIKPVEKTYEIQFSYTHGALKVVSLEEKV